MFELINPQALLLIPLPLFFWYLMPKVKIKLPTALKVPFFAAVLGIANQEKPSLVSQSSLMIPALIWILSVMALAGPRWVGEPSPVEREGYNLMMALDLSGSMEVPDMMLYGRPVSRLTVVKNAAEQFVRERSGDKIGLILFGSRAYLQTPLTYDRHTILMRLDDATVGLAGNTTSIGDAVGLAVKRLEGVPKKGRVIILLTDGANNSGILDPLKATELAKDEGIKIYTIGLGSDADSFAANQGSFMQNVTADLDEDTLKTMSAMTGGRYFRAADTETLHQIYNTINQLETVHQEQATVRPQKEYYPWFLTVALLLYLYWLTAQTNLQSKIRTLVRHRNEFTS